MRCRRVIPLAAIASLALLGATGASAAGPRIRLGHFAGYVWDSGPVTAVSATFTVPQIRRGSVPNATAATWIGAQAPGSDGPFIQIGVSELHVSVAALGLHHNDYVAFWSDTRRHFQLLPLFLVHAGDRIAASLRLQHNGWKLAIVDADTRVQRRFLTTDEARGAFRLGEFLQEDPTHDSTMAPYPYPRLTGVRFEQMRVDSQRARHLLSQWMTTPRGDLAPTPVSGDSFTVHRAILPPAAARYIRLAQAFDRSVRVFDARIATWNARTPRAQVSLASSAFALAVRANIRGFAGEHWPAAVHGLVRALLVHLRALLTVVTSAPDRHRSAAWRTAYHGAYPAIHRTALLIVGDLHGPTF